MSQNKSDRHKLVWIDKSAYIIVVLIPTIILIYLVWGFVEHGGVAGFAIFLCVFIFFILTSAHYLPLKLYENGLELANGKFPSSRRIFVSFKNIERIRINTSKRVDEGSSFLEFIRVEDINNQKYRNVIYEVSQFKRAMKNLEQLGLIKDESWLNDLPIKLKWR